MNKVIVEFNPHHPSSHWEKEPNPTKITDTHFFSSEQPITVSDGFHTFDELYDHRITLFIALCKMKFLYYGQVIECNIADGDCEDVWRSKHHSDGELAFGGTWFVLGIGKAKGEQITYHLPIGRWDETNFAETLDKAPEWDGHTPADVLERLKKL